MSFLELNIRGLYSKMPDLLQLIKSVSSKHPLDVLLLCETWLTKHTPAFTIPGYKICRVDRPSKRQGGMCILTSEKLRTDERADLKICNPEFKCCEVEFITNTQALLALSVYRPPNTNPTNFIRQLSNLVHSIRKSKISGLVIGFDHNVDFLKASTHGPTHQFLEQLWNWKCYLPQPDPLELHIVLLL